MLISCWRFARRDVVTQTPSTTKGGPPPSQMEVPSQSPKRQLSRRASLLQTSHRVGWGQSLRHASVPPPFTQRWLGRSKPHHYGVIKWFVKNVRLLPPQAVPLHQEGGKRTANGLPYGLRLFGVCQRDVVTQSPSTTKGGPPPSQREARKLFVK